jgi:HipA-like protein
MFSAIRRIFLSYRTDGHQGIETPVHEDATFQLHYGDLPIGVLQLHEGWWIFRYSPEFIGQGDVQPLVDFPNVHKTYRSASLWPFFMARIPSLAQPQVRETIKQEGLDEHSDVQLLRRFGRRTIANPFVLLESA